MSKVLTINAISKQSSLEGFTRKLHQLFVVAMAAALLSSCGSTPPLNFIPANVGMANHKIDAELKSLTVSVARQEEETGPLDFAWVGSAARWMMAVGGVVAFLYFTFTGKK